MKFVWIFRDVPTAEEFCWHARKSFNPERVDRKRSKVAVKIRNTQKTVLLRQYACAFDGKRVYE